MATRKSTSKTTKPLKDMTDDAINAMPSDKFADKFLAEMDAKPAQISLDDMNAVEKRWVDELTNRRCALVMLTKPFHWLRDTTQNDDEFAKAVAAISVMEGKIEYYKTVASLLEAAQWWAKIALLGREDGDKLVSDAKAELETA